MRGAGSPAIEYKKNTHARRAVPTATSIVSGETRNAENRVFCGTAWDTLIERNQ
jgi:hypothetical protein